MDMDGNKVRDTNLNKTFNLGIGKEELLSRFEKNAASVERDKYSHDKCLGIAARTMIMMNMKDKTSVLTHSYLIKLLVYEFIYCVIKS